MHRNFFLTVCCNGRQGWTWIELEKVMPTFSSINDMPAEKNIKMVIMVRAP